jgi:hypothetical protein
MAGFSNQLEEELVTLQRAASSRADVLMLPDLIAYLRNREQETAGRFDSRIIDEALSRSQGYWNWQMEYADRVQATPRKQRSSCPYCGGFASEIDCTDWANPRMRRMTKACGFCGVVADLPIWELEIRIVPETLVCSSAELTGSAEVSNNGPRSRTVTLGVAAERAGEMQPESIAKGQVVVDPGQTASFSFSLRPVKPMRELFQTRVYVASEGAFGLVSRNLLYGRDLQS